MQNRIGILTSTICFLAFMLTPAIGEDLREWSDISGNFTVEAQFVSQTEGSVVLLRRNGETVTVPKSRLCKNDLDLLEQLASDKPVVPKTERERLLEQLEKDLAEKIGPLDASAVASHANATAIYKKVVRLEKATRLSDRAAETLAKHRDEIAAADRETAKFKKEAEAIRDEFDQRRLEICAAHPIADEAMPIQFEGRWMTPDAHYELMQEREAAIKQARNQTNGGRLAKWVMTNLQNEYDMQFESKIAVLTKNAGIRFVKPEARQVYSLHPEQDSITTGPSVSGPSDYTYPFSVTWQTRGGQVMQKNGYVEIGFSDNGTAHLLGVELPFLDNPLDGNLAATRSLLDKALGDAFGR